ncbi:MAG: type II secretion system protein [Candidatus Paceibacterota bacterium]
MLRKKYKAFTLIELLVVIAIIGILSGFIFVSMGASLNAAKDAKRQTDVAAIQKALWMYEVAGNILPDTAGVACSLVPTDNAACDSFKTKLEQYLKTIPVDPDGTTLYTYTHDASVNNEDFVITGILSNGNTYGYDTTIGFYNTPATPPPEEGGITITEVAHIPESSMGNGEANDAYYDGSGYVFLANGDDGLRVYYFDGTNITPVDHVDDGGTALGLAYDGSVVYLANGTDGLRAYSFDPYAETPALGAGNNVNDGGEARSVYPGFYSGTRPALANGTDGLRQYSYNGSAFTALQNIDESSGEANAIDVWSAGDNWFYVANGTGGLQIYGQPIAGGAFTRRASINDGGTAYDVMAEPWSGAGAFVANGTDGLRFYSYDGAETIATYYHIDEGGSAMGIYMDNRYYYLANGTDGLRIYTDGGTNFVPAGHINSGGEARKVGAVDTPNYTYIFLANGTDGLRIYRIDIPNSGE